VKEDPEPCGNVEISNLKLNKLQAALDVIDRKLGGQFNLNYESIS
jgi:hypothetical protein